ncbi:MAG: hypothetical protein EP344_19290 [Bacteroidetes bacterium]|nr:MAG: hypothetical protein EP344_19290 [Bacteroidota bacterium]
MAVDFIVIPEVRAQHTSYGENQDSPEVGFIRFPGAAVAKPVNGFLMPNKYTPVDINGQEGFMCG